MFDHGFSREQMPEMKTDTCSCLRIESASPKVTGSTARYLACEPCGPARFHHTGQGLTSRDHCTGRRPREVGLTATRLRLRTQSPPPPTPRGARRTFPRSCRRSLSAQALGSGRTRSGVRRGCNGDEHATKPGGGRRRRE